MKSSFYYGGHYLELAERIKEYINSSSDFLSPLTAGSTRATGDAIESLIAEKFNEFIEDWCAEYSNDFARRAMADFAFKDKEGFYSVIDVKTHREGTSFNRPNLISVERLARFYELDTNVFSLLLIKYSISNIKVTVTEVIFTPIEYLSWACLTVGALGWGQIQIADSNRIQLLDRYSRKKWMLQFCDAMFDFYPAEILKINDRLERFSSVKNLWESKEDIWH